MQLTVDFLTVHFGRGGWTSLLVETVRSLDRHENLKADTIHIVDNSRDGWIIGQIPAGEDLRFHEFPIDERQVEVYHHDHAASLERGVQESRADILVVFDCDAHIMQRRFLNYLKQRILVEGFSAIAAPDTKYAHLGGSHPCFLALNKEARQRPLPFDSRAYGSAADIGRLIKTHLIEQGLSVYTPQQRRAFGGVWGYIFDEQVYHHGSATFRYNSDNALLSQVHPYASVFANSILRKRRYELTWMMRWYLRIHSRLRRVAFWRDRKP